MKSKIWLSNPHMSGNELDFVHEAYDTNWVAPVGNNVDMFEKELGKYLDVSAVASLSTGTAAIHLALILSGVSAGDFVMASSFTFSASVNPIVYQHATPILIDSEAESWNMCPEQLVKGIKNCLSKGKKPKAIVLVHLYGMPAKIDEILEIGNNYQIPVIEDAAEALGSKYKDKHTGTYGNMGILSFNGNKIITTSSGGALISNENSLIEKARFLSTQARDAAPHYEHSEIGFNYRMSNILAGIGRGQLMVIKDRVEQKRKIFTTYKERLADSKGIEFLPEPEGHFSNRWLTTITVDPEQTGGITRENLRLALEKENIESRPLWKPMHMQKVFKSAPAFTNGVSEKLFRNGLCLPSGTNLTRSCLDRVIDTIIKQFRVR